MLQSMHLQRDHSLQIFSLHANRRKRQQSIAFSHHPMTFLPALIMLTMENFIYYGKRTFQFDARNNLTFLMLL